jgi:hypothetical protein
MGQIKIKYKAKRLYKKTLFKNAEGIYVFNAFG